MASMDAAAALLAAAVRAAIQAGAPRRTVAAVAASTVGALVVLFSGASEKRQQTQERSAGTPGPSSDDVLRKSRSAKRREKRRAKRRQEAATHAGDRAEPLAAEVVAEAKETVSSMVRPRLEGSLESANLNLSPLREPPMKAKRMGDDGGGALPQVPVFPVTESTPGDAGNGRGGGVSSRDASPGSCTGFSVRSRPPGCESSVASDSADDRRPTTSGGKSRSRRRKGKIRS